MPGQQMAVPPSMPSLSFPFSCEAEEDSSQRDSSGRLLGKSDLLIIHLQQLQPQQAGQMANRRKVIVTGFEPFGEHTVNSSWVAVQELERIGLDEAVDLYVCEVPVEYQAVQKLLPSLWKEHQPQLVVHVGVSGLATTVTLEQCGHNKGYERLDNCSFCPASRCCMQDGPDCIKSVLDMDTVCKKVNDSNIGITVSVSKDAGRYLCDYTYYTSLYLGQGRSAFVHVPPLGKPYSSQDLGKGLQAVVQEMLKLLGESKDNEPCNHAH